MVKKLSNKDYFSEYYHDMTSYRRKSNVVLIIYDREIINI